MNTNCLTRDSIEVSILSSSYRWTTVGCVSSAGDMGSYEFEGGVSVTSGVGSSTNSVSVVIFAYL